ncbi:hypothetical protein [Frankia sp. R82]|uniref:hypothetical protein n=1 Tax=Frankia sp. R82 TaxID=2950553 RepID=UPI00204347B0|nr:hypothetical protein [Frankia sp. R82]MCM3883540.1 hypothetical protein [Frankia sp. R82]
MSSTPKPSPPVFIHVDGAYWELHHARSAASPIVVAELYPTGTRTEPVEATYRVAAPRWRLEESLGFVIPESMYQAVLAAPAQTIDAAPAAANDFPSADRDRWRPTRTSPVLMPGAGFATYGRILHDNAPLRTWEDGSHRIEIVSLTAGPAAAQAVSYRLWLDSDLTAADNVPVSQELDAEDDELVRQVAAHAITGRAPSTLTARQQSAVAAHGKDLLRSIALPASPYPQGTRVALVGKDGRPTDITVTVTDTITDANGATWYAVHPEISRIPGHPLREHPDAFLILSADDLVPTLQAPSSGIEPILSYGSRVRTIDHHTVTTGTVVRTFARADVPWYEIQADDLAESTVRLSAQDIEPISGSFWPSIDDLVATRTEAGIHLQEGEVLVSLSGFATVDAGPQGPVLGPERELPPRDPVLGQVWSHSHRVEPSSAGTEVEIEPL